MSALSEGAICRTCDGRGTAAPRVEVVTPNIIGERHDLTPCPDCDGRRRFFNLPPGVTVVYNDTGAPEPLLRA